MKEQTPSEKFKKFLDNEQKQNQRISQILINQEPQEESHEALDFCGLCSDSIEEGMKIVDCYAGKGIYKFEGIVDDAYSRYGEQLNDWLEGLKVAYAAHYCQATDEVTDQMTDPKEVRKFDIETYLNAKPITEEANLYHWTKMHLEFLAENQPQKLMALYKQKMLKKYLDKLMVIAVKMEMQLRTLTKQTDWEIQMVVEEIILMPQEMQTHEESPMEIPRILFHRILDSVK